MLWAAFTMAFFGFMHSGELCMQKVSGYDMTIIFFPQDVSVDNNYNPQSLKIKLKSLKTDPFRKGCEIHLGRTHDDLCPVSAVLSWMTIRGNSQGLLFHFKSGTPHSLAHDCQPARSPPRCWCLPYGLLRTQLPCRGCYNCCNQPDWEFPNQTLGTMEEWCLSQVHKTKQFPHGYLINPITSTTLRGFLFVCLLQTLESFHQPWAHTLAMLYMSHH